MNADGSNVTKLPFPTKNYPADPEWSPDGTHIVYVISGPGLNNTEIYAGNADGSGTPVNVSNYPAADDLEPSWSSDGARIAFASNRVGGAINNTEIYVMNADGSGQTRVTNTAAHDAAPAWQPRAAQPPATPTLLTEPGTTWAVTLDSVTQVADPFPVVSSSNFSADRRTRVALFAAGVNAPAAPDLTAEAEDSAGRRYPLPVEHGAPVPGLDWLAQVTVRLPGDLDGLDHVWVTLNVRGALTNKAVITLQSK